MRLERLRIEQLRQFHEPLEIRQFASGLNLFSGPNESGKSTLVRAIRAAFFERHRSRTVDDLMPWNDSSASPTIDIDFQLGETACTLRKRFMHGRRCELTIGSQRLDGAEAEDRLAQLLGFTFAAKGASRPEHWGIPGLLWIEQGSGQLVHDAVHHATDHLRNALNDSLGEIASSGGDEVLERVRSERAVLFTATGKATGPLAAIIDELAKAQTEMEPVTAQLAQYREKVDQLDALLRERAADADLMSSADVERDLEQARRAHAAVDSQAQSLAQDRSHLARLELNLALLREQLAAVASRERDLTERNAAVTRAQAHLEAMTAALGGSSQRQQVADEAYQQATHTVRAARQAEQRTALLLQVRDLQARLAPQDELVVSVTAQHHRLAELRALAAASVIEERHVGELRVCQQGLRDLHIQQQASATELHFDLLPGRQLMLDGDLLSGTGERTLFVAAELELPAVGRLRITPGGTDLARYAREQSVLQDKQVALLDQLGVATLELAEQRLAAWHQYRLDIGDTERMLSILAPDGLDAVLRNQAELTLQLGEAKATLDALPEAPPATRPAMALSLSDAEHALKLAGATLDRLALDANERRQALVLAQAEFDSAERERSQLQQLVQTPERQQHAQRLEQQFTDASAEHRTLIAGIEQRAQQLAAERPDILAQDIQRLERSVAVNAQKTRERDDQIIRLQSHLETVGAQDLEEQAGALAARIEHHRRRHNELSRRARALDLLLGLLQERRRDLVRRLQAPLKARLDHYLHLLFPQASLAIDEQLQPGALTRQGADGNQSGTFEALSFGAREQMGVVSRLAYADLLRNAGRPTLIILDDALVHSDAERLTHMKRILYDAATRHQVLLFTCHPEAWRDLGVVARPLATLYGPARS